METQNNIFGENYVGKPYQRIFVSPAEKDQFVKNYIKLFNAKIEYVFRIKEYYNLMVIGFNSPIGDVSLVVIEPSDLLKLPDYIQHTKVMYVVDSIDQVYENATKNDIKILQKRTPNIMGAQGRLELSNGYIIELAETTNKDLFVSDPYNVDFTI